MVGHRQVWVDKKKNIINTRIPSNTKQSNFKWNTICVHIYSKFTFTRIIIKKLKNL